MIRSAPKESRGRPESPLEEASKFDIIGSACEGSRGDRKAPGRWEKDCFFHTTSMLSDKEISLCGATKGLSGRPLETFGALLLGRFVPFLKKGTVPQLL